MEVQEEDLLVVFLEMEDLVVEQQEHKVLHQEELEIVHQQVHLKEILVVQWWVQEVLVAEVELDHLEEIQLLVHKVMDPQVLVYQIVFQVVQ